MWRICPDQESIALAHSEGLQVFALEFADSCMYLARLKGESSGDLRQKSSTRKGGTGTQRSRSKRKYQS